MTRWQPHSQVRRFVELGHTMPDSRDDRLSSRSREAWRCERCDVILWIEGDGATMSREVRCR